MQVATPRPSATFSGRGVEASSPQTCSPTTDLPRHARQDDSADEEVRHQEYLDKLVVPNLAEIESIVRVQEKKEEEVQRKYKEEVLDNEAHADEAATAAEREKAAGTIQKVYRGHRARRQLQGLSLDPSTRWVEAIREAQYRKLTTPHPRQSTEPGSPQTARPSSAKSNWHQISRIARHAHGESSDDSIEISPRPSASHHPVDAARTAHHRHQEKKEKEAWKGKMMDLPYFLEMVDLKHRYGSSLRSYHAEWKKSDTHENFFYWLDHGEGKNVEVPNVSRERLEREQVRYLSREERMLYLVDVDAEGFLRWRKNGELIDTTQEYRDSVEGIVRQEDSAKTFRQDEIAALKGEESNINTNRALVARRSSSLSGISTHSASTRYPDPSAIQGAPLPKKLIRVTPAVILNRLMRKSVKKNTWIFVADTRMNLYVGIKQSGAFQHSSFLHGSRISAAGLIKIKRGQLRSLSPLSGHYRPPTSAFRHFIAHLKDEQVDMSRVSVSKSYAVLVGLEVYMGGKKRLKRGGEEVKHGAEWAVHPDQARERHEREKDKSQSAKIAAEKQRQMEEESGNLGRKLKDVRTRVGEKWADREASRKAASRPGTADGKDGHDNGLRDKTIEETPQREDGGRANAESTSHPSSTDIPLRKKEIEPSG